MLKYNNIYIFINVTLCGPTHRPSLVIVLSQHSRWRTIAPLWLDGIPRSKIPRGQHNFHQTLSNNTASLWG